MTTVCGFVRGLLEFETCWTLVVNIVHALQLFCEEAHAFQLI